MQIDYLKMENYRQYNDCKVDFSQGTSDETGITIIKGDNGAGKSNLLNAITWCLYNEELHIEDEEKALPLPNTHSLANMEEGEKCKVKVELEIEDREGKRHNVERVRVFRKAGSSRVSEVEGAGGFTYSKEVNGDMKIQSNPEYIRDRNLPDDIKEYFFFDGEQLNQYFKSSSGKRIKNAVFDVSQIQVLDNALDHLKKRKKKYLKKADDLSPEVEEIRDKLEEKEDKLEEVKKNLEDEVEKRDNLRDDRNDLQDKLENHPDAEELENKKKELKKQRKKCKKKLEELESDRRENIVENFPFAIASEAIENAIEVIEEKKQKGAIPPKYRKEFIEDLLHNEECICGSGLHDNSGEREKVKEYLEKASDLNDLEEQLIEGHANLKTKFGDVLGGFADEQEKIDENISDWEDQLSSTNKEIESIESKLRNADETKIKQMQRKLDKLNSKIEEISGEIRELENKRDDLDEETDELDNQLDKELSNEEKYEDLKRINHFCKEAEKTGESVKEEIMEEVREDIESKTQKWFFELIWKKQTYDKVEIDEEYNISVYDKEGWDSLDTLAAGETQTLALSFMSAINTVSGFRAPLVIDTPLGRIAPNIKRNIASKIPDFLADRQLTLLVTGSEFTDEVKSELEDHIGKQYEIEFTEHPSGSEAEVVEYGK